VHKGPLFQLIEFTCVVNYQTTTQIFPCLSLAINTHPNQTQGALEL
jgi:hypothetical protein